MSELGGEVGGYVTSMVLFLGLNLKVIVVDVERREACDPVFLRAEQGWRVAELKTEIAEVRGVRGVGVKG